MASPGLVDWGSFYLIGGNTSGRPALVVIQGLSVPMFDDTDALFYENVVASFNKYVETKRSDSSGNSRDLKEALVAAAALYHFREHLPEAHKKDNALIAQQCPDFDLLKDVVNTSKHGHLTAGSNRQIDSADQIEERHIVTEYKDAEGTYSDIEKQVVVKLTNGTERDLAEVLVNVLNYWLNELIKLGITPHRPNYSLPQEKQPKTRATCNGGRFVFEIVRGLRANLRFVPRVFNYTSGAIEPLDFDAGWMELYKPANYCVDVSVRNNLTGEIMTRTVFLSDDENQKLLEYQTEKEKKAFCSSLPRIQEMTLELGRMSGWFVQIGALAESDAQVDGNSPFVGQHLVRGW
jgi:hypothetical protein